MMTLIRLAKGSQNWLVECEYWKHMHIEDGHRI